MSESQGNTGQVDGLNGNNKTKETNRKNEGMEEEEDTILNIPLIDLTKLEDFSNKKMGGYEFFEKVLKRPKYVLAPMVDASELTFRMMVRKYNTQLCYSPMFNSVQFVKYKKYRQMHFTTCPEDRPLVVQFCGNNPNILVQAAKYVEDHCDAIDLNLGCPQRIAKKGHYGAFLMDEPELVYEIVSTLHKYIKIPIFCKIRIFNDFEKTLKFALMVQKAGCQLLTIHGRTREMKGHTHGAADWDVIRRIREHMTIPVIANGNIDKFDDIEECLKATKADAVMSAVTILSKPDLFANVTQDSFVLAYEYLDFAEKYETDMAILKNHILQILNHVFDGNFGEARKKETGKFFGAKK